MTSPTGDPLYEGRDWISFDRTYAAVLGQLDRIEAEAAAVPAKERDQASDQMASMIPMIGRAEDGALVIIDMIRDEGLVSTLRPRMEAVKQGFAAMLAAARVRREDSAQDLATRLEHLAAAARAARLAVTDLESAWRDARARGS